MSLRVYRIVSTNTASGTGQATATVVQRGVIVGVGVSAMGQGGAADGFYATEVSLNNTSVNQAATNGAVSENIIAKHYHSYDAGVAGASNFFQPVNRPVAPGNVLSINQTLTGTASAAVFTVAFDVLVNE